MAQKQSDHTYLETIAKGLYNIAMRGGPLEDFHAEQRSIGQKEMEQLNRYAFNRLGYMFQLIIDGDMEQFDKLCWFNAQPLSYFDALDLDSEEVRNLKEEYEEIQQFLNE